MENGFDSNNILFQRWFHCKDLGKELGPVIKEYFASEQHKTGHLFLFYSQWCKYQVQKGSIRKKPSTIRYNDGTLHFSGLPIQEDLNANPSYWKEDQTRRVEEPFVLKTFLDENQDKITASNETDLFDSTIYKSDVKLLGHGQGIKCTFVDCYLLAVKTIIIPAVFRLLKHPCICRCKDTDLRWWRNLLMATPRYFKHYYR